MNKILVDINAIQEQGWMADVVCNMYIIEHGAKVNDTWHVEHHLFFESI